MGYYPFKRLSICPGFKNKFGGYPSGKTKIYLHGINEYKSKPKEYWKWILSHEIAHIYFGFCVKSEKTKYQVCGLNWLMIGLGLYLDRMFVTDNQINYDFHENILSDYKKIIEEGKITSLRISKSTVEKNKLVYYNSIVLHGKPSAIIKYIEMIKSKEYLKRKIIELTLEYKNKVLTLSDLFKVLELNKTDIKRIRSFLTNSKEDNLFLIDAINMGYRNHQ